MVNLPKQQATFLRRPPISALSTLPPAPIIHLATPPILSCHGCKTLYSEGDLNDCVTCRQFFCNDCSCSCNTLPALALIVTKAQARVANHIRNAPGVSGLDPFLLIIEDEYGDLVHTQGILSFLMPSQPVLHQQFAHQLNLDIQPEYEKRQLEVWEQILVDGQPFCVAPEWKASILPFLVEESRYTVTIFFHVA